MARKGRDITERTMDPAAQAILARAEQLGIMTAFTRAEMMPPCTIGSGKSGMCCKNCFMGPCRITKDGQVGICGATVETIAARNLARAIASGAAAHSDHGRDLAFTLEAVALGQAPGYAVRDVAKLWEVARRVGVPTEGRTVNDVALDVARKALAEFGQQRGELSYLRTAPKRRYELWKKLDLAPRGIDREVVDTLHRTHMGDDQDPEHILRGAMRTALADGWGGSMWATDLSDILFGTPSPKVSQVNLGVLKRDEVNILVHGHEPTLSEMIVAAVQDPELLAYARSKGANGITLAGICCTSNEVLMRQGVPSAGNFLHQELAILTGAVEAMVVDVQCIMQALPNLAERFHTKVITTSSKVKIPGALHMEFDEHRALQVARDIVRLAIDNFPNRGEVLIPDVKADVVPGFSHEYLNYMLGGTYRGSFRPLNDAIMAGRIRGVAAVVGCNNPKVTQDKEHYDITTELLRNDVLVVQTGCGAIAAGKYGMLLGEAALELAGPGLREVCEAVGIPPVLHMGSCVDNSRILTVLTQMVTEGGLGEDISDLPAVGIAPEWMSEKALAIGTYAAASGAYVLFGVESPYEFSEEVSRLISAGWESMVGGKLEFVSDPQEIVRRALEHIDKKRAALKLPAYDPTKFGQSGDYPLQYYFELPLEEQQALVYGVPAREGNR
ncbi:MAG: anaerobic carbon-monoxide dehydrogenase catalytic subunit [Caldilineales bacterium]|nr:anaerobic carbon-monoxide dehydrogenase catalytic subunit [Caldilineales bacterium]MDW8316744.1 anaerobic carbon-monoxide dehydrogenase catalytic subunit [Anaerolineae bacterium]